MNRRVTLHHVEAGGRRIHARVTAPPRGQAILFVHGNCSSSLFWEGVLRALPAPYCGHALDLRGFGDSDPLPIDATRGLRDLADDVADYAAAAGLVGEGRRVLLVGHSVGGGVAMQAALDHPDWFSGLVLEDPVAPYGFGGTRDVHGTPCHPDFAGSGAGAANPDFVRMLAERRSDSGHPSAPRSVLNRLVLRPPFRSPDEEELLASILSTRVGDDHYPGDSLPSPNWPGVAPGRRGIVNAVSPRHLDLSGFADLPTRPPLLWIQGADDAIVSDRSLLDFGHLGQQGIVPGWPGPALFPPQPMVGQIRALLTRYRERGGSYRAELLPDCGHSPHVERPAEFMRLLLQFASDLP